MITVNAIDTITAWVQERICNQIKLKVPDDKVMDAGYKYQTANPTAFSMFIPAQDRVTPPAPPSFPCCCVQIIAGDDRPIESSRLLSVRLSFATWSPGKHGPDEYVQNEDGTYTRSTASSYQKNEEGWRDSWNFLDLALKELQSTDTVNGIRIMQEEGFKFGPFVDEQKAIADLWPYWYTWLEFRVDIGLNRHNQDHDGLL